MIARAINLVRWLPVVAAVVYAFVLVRRLGTIIDQLTWNADYVSQIAIAQSIGTAGKSGRAIVIQIGYLWFDLATHALPLHQLVWLYAPAVMALATLALLAWTAWLTAGRFAALLTASLGLAASPLVLGTQLAQAYHGSTWFGTALLAAYLCWLIQSRAGRRVMIGVSVLVALLVGFATASDPLLGPAADAPFLLAGILVWRARVAQIPRGAVVVGAVTLAGAGAVTLAMLAAARLAGYASSFPRGLTHVVPREHLMGNLRQLVSGIFEVAGMPHQGSALGVVLGLLLVAGVLLPLAWLISSVRGSLPAAQLAVAAFWSASLVCVAGAFLLSDVPADFLENSARYLVPVFFVAVATVPIWAAADERRLAILAAPAVVFILANAAAVEQGAGSGAFGPFFSDQLGDPIAFLEQHGLTRGYAAYDEASPISWKSDFALRVYPVTEVMLSPDEACGQAICPFAYNAVSDWYSGQAGPTFILIDPAMYRLSQPPPPSLDGATAVYHVGRFVIYVYGDDVATHMGIPRKFTRPLI